MSVVSSPVIVLGGTPDIPFDIVFTIFKQLHRLGWRGTLRSCAQTCRLWHSEAQKMLSSAAMVFGTAPMNDPTGWVRWQGQFMTVPGDATRVSQLHIKEDAFIDLDWLTSALRSLPRLRYLSIYVTTAPRFPTTPLPAPFELPDLEHFQLESHRDTQYPYDKVLALFRCFSKAKSISIKRVSIDLPKDHPIAFEIAPYSVSIDGLSHRCYPYWFRVLRQPRAAQAIRRLRICFYDFSHVAFGGCAALLRSLKNIEAIEFDFAASLKEREITSSRTLSRIIERDFAPAFPSTIRTLRLRLPEARQFSHYWPSCLALLQAMPATLRHIELCVSNYSQYFEPESVARCLVRYTDLRTLEVILDEKEVMDKDAEEIAKYRKFLQEGFPNLSARGALRLTAELRSHWLELW